MAAKACGVGMNITSDQPFTVQLMHEGRSAHRCALHASLSLLASPAVDGLRASRWNVCTAPHAPVPSVVTGTACVCLFVCVCMTARDCAGWVCSSGIIKPGDVIAMIDGVPLAGETVAKLTQLMLGAPGSLVELTLYRGAQTIVVWLIRSPSKLTPLQVNQQREAQNAGKNRSGGKGGVMRERSAMSRMTENSFLVSQSSYASIDDNEYRELGGEQSWDPDALASQPSLVASEASFDPERVVFNQMSEKSFDPEAMQDERDLMSERSFDPEMLVQMSEKSFDPESFDADAHSMASEKSFDPEMMGFMSEKSFDPEAQEALNQMSGLSLSSQKSFDPEMLDLEDLR
jgi:hypothetical protein